VSVTDALRRDILAAVFAPGERLVEAQLTDRYQCGRGAVRAALVELSGEGLIERSTHRGATVRRITVDEAIQITEARAALESIAAAHAAQRAAAADRRELRAVLAEMRRAVKSGDGRAYSQCNAQLHATVLRLSGHEVAAELVQRLRNRAAPHQFALAAMPDRPAASLAQHAAIVDAIVRGDADGAADAMRTHLVSVIAILERWREISPRA
jgi:DNA-binding GntR family transcriptional regulator